MLCCLPGLALRFVWPGTNSIAWHHPLLGDDPAHLGKRSGLPAHQHGRAARSWPGAPRKLRGSSAASPHGAAPHGAWAALCTGASSGEGDRDTDKVRDRQRYNGRCRCGLQPLARPVPELHRWAETTAGSM